MRSEIRSEFLPDSGTRCSVAVPAGDVHEGPRPLVLCLHYGGPVSPWYGRGLLESVVEPGLRALGAVIVAPDGDCPQWRNPACEAVCREALSYAKANFAIEDQKSLITGYSKGGIGTWDLGLRLADSFSAAIVMAGQPPPNFEVGKWALPVRVLHGEDDELLPLEQTQSLVEHLKESGADVELEVLSGVSHFEVDVFAESLESLVPWISTVWD